jgi:membrane fusion protein (multidrug efflux system)
MQRQIRKAIVVALGAGFLLGSVKGCQIWRVIQEQQSYKMPPHAVTTRVVQQEKWRTEYSAVGSFVAMSGATLSVQESGNVVRVGFESGSKVSKGQVLLELDSSVEQANLKGALARLELSRQNLARSNALKTQSALSLATLEQAQSRLRQDESEVQSIKATIEKKTILAPFAGRAGIRAVNIGQYVTSGSPIVPLYSIDPIYFNFSLPQQVAPLLTEQLHEVAVSVDAFPDRTFQGKLTASNPNVNEVLRTIDVQATVPNATEELIPGMFGSVRFELGDAKDVAVVPLSSVSYAPYGNSVFVIERKSDEQGQVTTTVRQQIVQLGARRGDFVAVTAGLNSGDEVVTSGVSKLRQGEAVAINNSVQLPLSENPVVEDT